MLDQMVICVAVVDIVFISNPCICWSHNNLYKLINYLSKHPLTNPLEAVYKYTPNTKHPHSAVFLTLGRVQEESSALIPWKSR